MLTYLNYVTKKLLSLMVVLGSEILIKSGIKMQKLSNKMLLLFLSLCCFVTLQAQELQPSYTVVAPKIVRPNSDFLVAVSLYNIADEAGTIIVYKNTCNLKIS